MYQWDEMSPAGAPSLRCTKQEPADSDTEEINTECQIPEYQGNENLSDASTEDRKDIEVKDHHLVDSWKDTTIQDLLDSYRRFSSPGSSEILFRSRAQKDKPTLMLTVQRLALRVKPRENIYNEVVPVSSFILPRNKPGFHFRCDKCKRSYRYKHTLKQHQDNDCGKPPHLKCPECDHHFMQMHSLKSHFKGHHPDKTWVPLTHKQPPDSLGNVAAHRCDSCGKFYNTLLRLRAHISRYCGNDADVLRCTHCAYTTKLRWHMRAHMKNKHSSERLPPPVKPKRSRPKVASVKRGRPTKTQRRYKCNKCYSFFCQAKRLVSHECGEFFKCAHCAVGKKNRTTIVRHLQQQHPQVCGLPPAKELRRKCDKCYKFFAAPSKLKRHERHCKAEKLKCPVTSCTYRSPFKECIQKHVRNGKHIGQKIEQSDKVWPCQICGNCYVDKGSLIRHTLYKCGKETQLDCPQCPYRAKRNCTLKAHMLLRHKQDLEDALDAAAEETE